MDTVIARITMSLIAAVIAAIGYALVLILLRQWFDPAVLSSTQARTVYYLIEGAMLLACVVLPNLSHKFDRSSVAAILVSAVLVVPIWVLSLLTTGCGVFGDCL